MAKVTGESVGTIGQIGFSIADPRHLCHDPEPSDFSDVREIEDRIIDWDRYDGHRNVPMVPQRSRGALFA